jgi:hypothetical protein
MDDYDPAPDPAPGKRIAQLLASEIEGRAGRGLGPLAVADARPEADPSAAGVVAYRVTADGRPVATVLMYPDHAELAVESGTEAARGAAREADLPVADSLPLCVSIPDGGAVKRVLPALAAAAAAGKPGQDADGE